MYSVLRRETLQPLDHKQYFVHNNVYVHKISN